MASTFSGSGMIPVQVMRCPRKSRVSSPNWHLETLMTKPCSRSRWNSRRRCCLCASTSLLATKMSFVDKGELRALTDGIHQPLERLSSILQTEWHPEEFKEPKRSNDCCFGDVFSSHRNLVVASDEINLGEYRPASEVGGEILYVGHWISVRNCGIIESSVVSTRTPAPRSFRHHV